MDVSAIDEANKKTGDPILFTEPLFHYADYASRHGIDFPTFVENIGSPDVKKILKA